MKILRNKLIGIPEEQLRIRAKCFHHSGSFKEFRREDLDQSIVEKLEQQVERFPDRLAVKTQDCEVTYRELNQTANRIAHRLFEHRGTKSEPVAMLFENGVPFVQASLGILKSGKIQLPLESSFPRERLAYMLEQSTAALILTNSANLNLAKKLSRLPVINVDEIDQDTPSTNPGLLLCPENQVAINYTSGSTGKPKGIVRTHTGVLHDVMNYTNTFRLCFHDRLVIFRAGTIQHFYALLNGASVFPVNLRIMEPSKAAGWIHQENITIFRAAVSTFRTITAALTGNEAFPHLRLICLFGEATYEKDAKLYRRHFSDQCLLASSLGTSEFGDFAYYFVEKASKVPGGVIPGGYPIESAEILLLDKSCNPVKRGEVGEIAVRSRYGASGYWRRPDLTNDKFIVDAADEDTRTFKTGDLGRVGTDGCIFHLGRKDFQVKVRGNRVDILEVETALLECETIKQAVVCGREDTPGNTQLVAYLISTNKNKTSVSYLRRLLAKMLPDYMIPSFFVWLDTFPLTPTGKVDRRALPAPGNERPKLETTFLAPQTPAEQRLTEIWAEVLNIKTIGIHDDFFELGGDSLLAVQINARIRDLFQVELPLHRFFNDSTVAGLAKLIEVYSHASQDLEAYPIHAVNRDQELPLSFAQQRLWFLDKLEPDSSLYNVIRAIKLKGPIDVEALQNSLNTIVSRHEALRTTFISVKDKVVQTISEPHLVNLPVNDLSNLSAFDREAEVKRFCQEEAQRPFDLSSDLMIRATLFRMDSEEHILLLVLHHIATDEWSMSLLFRELSISYEAFSRAEYPVLPELPIQYADFAAWQHQWLQGDVFEKQLEYWKSQLEGATFVLDLPTDRPRPAVQSFRGAKQSIELSSYITKALRSFCQTERTTLFMTMIAAFNVLLHRYTGQNDILVGSPIANRSRIEIQGLIGFFLNTIVLRTDFSGDPSFRELLARVRKVCLDAYAHQDLPFEKMVEVLQPDRDLSHSPLFRAMLVLQNDLELDLQLSGLNISPFDVDSGTAKFDLFFFVVEKADGLSCVLEYNTDLFNEATIKRMLEHFKILVNGIAKRPDTSVSQLPLLTDAEQHMVLIKWNNTEKDYPKQACLHKLFEEQVKRRPEAVAFVFENQQMTYGELNRRANQVAHHLRSLRVEPGVLIGVCMEPSLEMIVALLGTLKAGGAYVPLDPTYPKERLAFMLQDSGVPALLTQKRLLSGLPEHEAKVICLDSDWKLIANESDENPDSGAADGELAYVMYTSGSTGKAKGVLGLHRGAVNRFNWMWEAYPFEADEICCQKTSISFVDSVWEIFGPLLQGIPNVIIPDSVLKDPQHFLNSLTENDVSRIVMVPSLLRILLDIPGGLKQRLPHLRHWTLSGEALPVDLARRFMDKMPDCTLLNLYGSSEVSADVTFCEVSRLNDFENGVPIGRPISNIQAYVLNPSLQPQPIGVAGELFIGGDGLARGYLNRIELTAERFITHPFDVRPGSRLYKTGDLAKYLPDGSIEVLGRLDFQVKVRGFRIELGDIEATLEQHPAVRQAVVTAREDIPGDKQLVAYLVANDYQTIPVNALHSFLKKKLPAYMIPQTIVFLEALPLTPTGKVDRRTLPRPDHSRPELHTKFVSPKTAFEKNVAEMWSELLGLEKIGIYDNFFELGGHSLLATRLINRILDVFQVRLPLKALWEAPTIADLAAAILKAKAEQFDEQELNQILEKIEASSEK